MLLLKANTKILKGKNTMNQNELFKKAIDTNGETMQMIVAIEEMAELTKELSKHVRGENNKEAIIEELADVHIMLEQIMIMLDINLAELAEMINKKAFKLENHLKGVNEVESV